MIRKVVRYFYDLYNIYRHSLVNNSVTLNSSELERDAFVHGYKIFSQHEEDGIIDYIFKKIGINNKVCIEICCGKAYESNTANLLINQFWDGLLFEGSKYNAKIARKFYKSHPNTRVYPPKIINDWITKDNINDLISNNGISGEIDFLSLDIDGNDYYIWEAINVISPRLVVLEYNHILGPEKSLTIPYDPNFVAEFTKDGADYSGASLMAFVKLAKRKGYRLIATNRFSTNAFFLRNDIVNDEFKEISPRDCFYHGRAKYGMKNRYKNIQGKKWVEV